MAQVGSLGLVGDGRSQAERCVPFPATSALSLPWLFKVHISKPSGTSPRRISNVRAGTVGLDWFVCWYAQQSGSIVNLTTQ